MEKTTTKVTVTAPASGGYVVVTWPKTAATPALRGGYKGASCTCSRATRYRAYKKIASKDWGQSPAMLSFSSREVLSAETVSQFARWLIADTKTIGLGCVARLEFQERKSAHLHAVIDSIVSKPIIERYRAQWLEHIGATRDKHVARYGFHAMRVKSADSKFLMLYVGGHTSKGDYQSVAPYPVRQWFWYNLQPLPDLTDTGLIVSRETFAKLRYQLCENRPASWGGTVILSIDELAQFG